MSKVKVVTRLAGSGAASQTPARREADPPLAHPRAVLIGASTGGPRALLVVLTELPTPFPVPILVAQHIAAGFERGLCDWLKSNTGHEVLLAADGERLESGRVYVSPADGNLVFSGPCSVRVEPPVVGHVAPNVDRLFLSAVEHLGRRVCAALLTGMGCDGAEGLLALRQAGAVTIAQDEETSTIFGMPGEAIRLGGAERVLPVHEIGAALAGLFRGTIRSAGGLYS